MSNLPHLNPLARLGLRLALIFCRALSSIIFFVFTKIWRYREEVVLSNLSASFPDFGADQIKHTVRSYFKHLADLIVEPLLIRNLTKAQLSTLVEFENISLIKSLLAEQKSIVLIASHAGNWEYLHLLPVFTECEVFAAYSPVSNRFINNALMRMRSRFGVQLIAKSDWYRSVMKRGRKQPAIFVTVADQRPEVPGKICIDFLNQKTFFQPGAARIATNIGCALVYLDVFQKARNTYSFGFELITDAAQKQDEANLIDCYVKTLEKTIRRQPELWLWSHKRWQFRVRQAATEHRREPVSV
ncbi:lysophospholipid acyltransferase family protein [Dyadobacter crusticola]|uniref:lysophospholipid acyltransferase family protein n=1 Tax=Dyadobacter crusticola TaxID=292407 RepID=UPI000AF6DFED|nr:lysophospholipid acyltransferase family protein [Dyadobacter crusticola]